MIYTGRVVECVYGLDSGESYKITSEPFRTSIRGEQSVLCERISDGEEIRLSLDEIHHSIYYKLKPLKTKKENVGKKSDFVSAKLYADCLVMCKEGSSNKNYLFSYKEFTRTKREIAEKLFKNKSCSFYILPNRVKEKKLLANKVANLIHKANRLGLRLASGRCSLEVSQLGGNIAISSTVSPWNIDEVKDGLLFNFCSVSVMKAGYIEKTVRTTNDIDILLREIVNICNDLGCEDKYFISMSMDEDIYVSTTSGIYSRNSDLEISNQLFEEIKNNCRECEEIK